MTVLRKFFLIFLLIIGISTEVAANPAHIQTVTSPDFAFPKKVVADAKRQLSKALQSGDDVGALRAMIDLTVAEGSTDSDNAQRAYSIVEKSADAIKSDAVRALVRMLQASILKDYYIENSSEFDERETPIEPLPKNWNEWTTDQFEKEIFRLIDEALSNEKALLDAPTMEFAMVLNIDPIDAIYFPSLFDVISYQAISLIEYFDDDGYNEEILPPTMIRQVSEADINPLTTPKSKIINKTLSIYSGLIRANVGRRMAPYTYATVEALDFVADRINTYTEEWPDADELKQQELLRLFEKYESISEYAGDFLLALLYSKPDNEDKLFTRVKAFVERYPAYRRVGCLKREINMLLTPNVSLKFPPKVEPGVSFPMTAKITNSQDTYIKIYRLKRVSDSKKR